MSFSHHFLYQTSIYKLTQSWPALGCVGQTKLCILRAKPWPYILVLIRTTFNNKSIEQPVRIPEAQRMPSFALQLMAWRGGYRLFPAIPRCDGPYLPAGHCRSPNLHTPVNINFSGLTPNTARTVSAVRECSTSHARRGSDHDTSSNAASQRTANPLHQRDGYKTAHTKTEPARNSRLID